MPATTRTQIPAPRTTAEGTRRWPVLTRAELVALTTCTSCGCATGHARFCVDRYGEDRD